MVDGGSGEVPSVSAPAGCGCCVDLRQLVHDHYQAVYRYAFRLSGRHSDAEDLTQQTYLLAQQRLHQIREPEKADRWLMAIVRSCFLKGIAKSRPVLVDSLEMTVEDTSDAVRQSRSFDSEELQQVLNELPDDYRLIVVMFYFDELSYKEIAEQLEIPIGTVMSRLARAKARLRDKLSVDDDSPAQGAAASGWSRY